MMLALENLIPCHDVARLAVNDVNFGDEAVCLFIILNHVINIKQLAPKVKPIAQNNSTFFLSYPTAIGGDNAKK